MNEDPKRSNACDSGDSPHEALPSIYGERGCVRTVDRTQPKPVMTRTGTQEPPTLSPGPAGGSENTTTSSPEVGMVAALQCCERSSKFLGGPSFMTRRPSTSAAVGY